MAKAVALAKGVLLALEIEGALRGWIGKHVDRLLPHRDHGEGIFGGVSAWDAAVETLQKIRPFIELTLVDAKQPKIWNLPIGVSGLATRFEHAVAWR